MGDEFILVCDICPGTEWEDYSADHVMCKRCGNVQRVPVEVRNERDKEAVGVARTIEENAE